MKPTNLVAAPVDLLLVTVTRVGGLPAVRQYLDAARIDINVWGSTKTEAQTIAQKARGLCMDLEGQAVTSPVAAWVSGVEDALGMTYLPDQATNVDRYVFSVRVFARAN